MCGKRKGGGSGSCVRGNMIKILVENSQRINENFFEQSNNSLVPLLTWAQTGLRTSSSHNRRSQCVVSLNISFPAHILLRPPGLDQRGRVRCHPMLCKVSPDFQSCSKIQKSCHLATASSGAQHVISWHRPAEALWPRTVAPPPQLSKVRGQTATWGFCLQLVYNGKGSASTHTLQDDLVMHSMIYLYRIAFQSYPDTTDKYLRLA